MGMHSAKMLNLNKPNDEFHSTFPQQNADSMNRTQHLLEMTVCLNQIGLEGKNHAREIFF